MHLVRAFRSRGKALPRVTTLTVLFMAAMTYVSGAADDVDLSFFSSRGGAFPSTGYVGCEIIDSRGASLQYPILHYPDNGYARIGDISSSSFIFSLGSGRGFLELYDEQTGEVSARADLISWVKVDGLRLEELGPGYQSLMADIHVLVIPEPATWLISAAGLWILAALRRIARREPQVNNCCLSNARNSARWTFLELPRGDDNVIAEPGWLSPAAP